MDVNNFEVYTTTDKAKRDELYRALREHGEGSERQAVKFSGVAEVDGKYQTTYSVAHPKG
jgi:hypothetical protein